MMRFNSKTVRARRNANGKCNCKDDNH